MNEKKFSLNSLFFHLLITFLIPLLLSFLFSLKLQDIAFSYFLLWSFIGIGVLTNVFFPPPYNIFLFYTIGICTRILLFLIFYLLEIRGHKIKAKIFNSLFVVVNSLIGYVLLVVKA
jgi:hypothetical protein